MEQQNKIPDDRKFKIFGITYNRKYEVVEGFDSFCSYKQEPRKSISFRPILILSTADVFKRTRIMTDEPSKINTVGGNWDAVSKHLNTNITIIPEWVRILYELNGAVGYRIILTHKQ